MAETIIYKIKDVRVGDIVYYDGSEKGARVVGVDLRDEDNSRLSVETPEVFKPFTAYRRPSVWLKDSYFHHATREIPDKRLPAVTRGHPQAFFTQSGETIYYDGEFDSQWNVWDAGQAEITYYSDEELKNHLSASEFPLRKAIPGEVAE